MAINDPRFRYAQQLVQSGTDTSPVQHWTQGASRLAQALLGAHMQNKIEQENKQAQQAMVSGFGAQPWINPDTGQVAPNQGPVGGIEGAQAALARQDNPAASRLASQLMDMQMNQMLENQQFDRRRQAGIEDYRTQKTIDQEFAPEPDRFETVQNPYGRGGVAQRNVKTGQIVNYQGPAEGPKPQFMNIGGQIVAINPNDMTATSLGQFGQPDAKAPTVQTFYDDQGNQYKAQWNPQTQGWDRVGGAKPPSGMQFRSTPDGGFELIQGPGKLTEAQSKDAVYATRAEGALPVIDKHGETLTNPVARFVENDPTGIARGYAQTPEFQQAQQAGLEFLQAILRKDTGAAITSQEQNEYGRVYLPTPGDSPEVLQQKQVSRRRALEALKAGMAPQAILNQELALQRTNDASQQPTQDRTTQSGIRYRVFE